MIYPTCRGEQPDGVAEGARRGGSIGAVATMQQEWKAPVLFLGLSLLEHGYHAPNEYSDWGQASGGINSVAAYFLELTKLH